MEKPSVSRMKYVLLTIWMILVSWAFFRNFPLVNLLEVLQNGFLLLFLLLCFTGLGRRLFRLFKAHFSNIAEEWSFSFGLGSGVIAFLVIGLAAFHILHEIVVVGLIVVVGCFVYSDIKALCIEMYHAFNALTSRTFHWGELLCLFLLAIAGLSTFLAAATPPFFFDALVYHLAVPQQYLLSHGFRDMPHHHFSNFPMNVGMLFTVGMSFTGGMLAKLISWSFAPMSALAVYGFAKTRWGHQMALMAATILSLVPGVLILSILTSIDLAVMFYSFLSFSALLFWFENRRKSWFLLSGMFCGFAVGTKYTALVTTFAVILIVLGIHEGFHAKKHRLLAGIRFLVIFSLIVFGMMLPWFLKNILYTGNPVYPLFNSFIGTNASHQYGRYDRAIAERPSLYKLLTSPFEERDRTGPAWWPVVFSYLKAPWTYTMRTTRAAGKTGAIFLLCLPLALSIAKMEKTPKYLFALGGCSFGLWVVLLPETALRYVFQMFPPFSLVVAYLIWSFPGARRMRSALLGGVFALLAYHLFLFGGELNALSPGTFLLNNLSQEEFLLSHGVNYYPVTQFINREIPEDANILYVGELRGYYCERSLLLATDGHRINEEIILRQLIIESQSVQDVLRKLQQRGITHIFMNSSEMQRFAKGELGRDSFFGFETTKDNEIFQAFFSHNLRLLVSEYQVELYEVLYPEQIL